MGGRNELGFDITAHDLASREVARVGGAIDGVAHKAEHAGGRFSAFGGTVRSVANGALMGVGMAAFNSFAGAIGNVSDGIVGGAAAFERYEVQFGVLLGSTEAAKQRMKELAEFGAKTPFELPGVVQADKILTAFGIESKKQLQIVGDAAAGTGASLDQMATVFGRISAGSYGEAFMRLAELGIATRKDLEAEGLQFDKGGSYKGSAEQAMAAVNKIVSERFGGMMEKQSQTLEGQWSNVQDMIGAALRGIGEEAMPVFKSIVAGILEIGPKVGPVLRQIAAAITPILQNAMTMIGRLLDALAPVGDVVGRIVDMFAGGKDVVGEFGNLIPDVADGIGNLATTIGDTLVDAFESALPVVGQFLLGIGEQVLAALPAIGDAFLSLAGRAVDWIAAAIPGLLAGLASFAQTILDWVLNSGVPMLATALGHFAEAFVAWLPEAVGKLLPLLGQFASSVLNFIVTNAPKIVGKLAEWAGAFVAWIGPKVPVLLGKLGELLAQVAGWIVNTGLPTLISNLAKWAGELVAWVGPKIPVLLGELGKLLGQVVSWIIGTGIPTLIGKAAELGVGLVTGFMREAPRLLGRLVEWVTGSLIPGIVNFGVGIARAALEMAGRFVGGFINGLASLPGKLVDAIGDAFRSIRIDIGPFHISANGISIDLPKIDLPHFATGAWELPSDMVAMVHKGEMVIPADIAARLRGEATGTASAFAAADLSRGTGAGLTQVTVDLGLGERVLGAVQRIPDAVADHGLGTIPARVAAAVQDGIGRLPVQDPGRWIRPIGDVIRGGMSPIGVLADLANMIENAIRAGLGPLSDLANRAENAIRGGLEPLSGLANRIGSAERQAPVPVVNIDLDAFAHRLVKVAARPPDVFVDLGFGERVVAAVQRIPGAIAGLGFDTIPARVATTLRDVVERLPALDRIVDRIGEVIRIGVQPINALNALATRIEAAIRAGLAPLEKLAERIGNVTAKAADVPVINLDLDAFADRLATVPVTVVVDLSRLASAVAAGVRDALAPLMSARTGGGTTVNVTIHQNFGPSSVRSREDIRQIGIETAQRARLLGLTVGSAGATG